MDMIWRFGVVQVSHSYCFYFFHKSSCITSNAPTPNEGLAAWDCQSYTVRIAGTVVQTKFLKRCFVGKVD